MTGSAIGVLHFIRSATTLLKRYVISLVYNLFFLFLFSFYEIFLEAPVNLFAASCSSSQRYQRKVTTCHVKRRRLPCTTLTSLRYVLTIVRRDKRYYHKKETIMPKCRWNITSLEDESRRYLYDWKQTYQKKGNLHKRGERWDLHPPYTIQTHTIASRVRIQRRLTILQRQFWGLPGRRSASIEERGICEGEPSSE